VLILGAVLGTDTGTFRKFASTAEDTSIFDYFSQRSVTKETKLRCKVRNT